MVYPHIHVMHKLGNVCLPPQWAEGLSFSQDVYMGEKLGFFWVYVSYLGMVAHQLDTITSCLALQSMTSVVYVLQCSCALSAGMLECS